MPTLKNVVLHQLKHALADIVNLTPHKNINAAQMLGIQTAESMPTVTKPQPSTLATAMHSNADVNKKNLHNLGHALAQTLTALPADAALADVNNILLKHGKMLKNLVNTQQLEPQLANVYVNSVLLPLSQTAEKYMNKTNPITNKEHWQQTLKDVSKATYTALQELFGGSVVSKTLAELVSHEQDIAPQAASLNEISKALSGNVAIKTTTPVTPLPTAEEPTSRPSPGLRR